MKSLQRILTVLIALMMVSAAAFAASKNSRNAAPADIFIRTVLSDSVTTVDGHVTMAVRIYSRLTLEGLDMVGNPTAKNCEIEVADSRARLLGRDVVNRRQYYVYQACTYTVTPHHSGRVKITIPSIEVEAVTDPGDWFWGIPASTDNVVLDADPVSITVTKAAKTPKKQPKSQSEPVKIDLYVTRQ